MVTVIRLAGHGGLRSVVAESALIRHQMLIFHQLFMPAFAGRTLHRSNSRRTPRRVPILRATTQIECPTAARARSFPRDCGWLQVPRCDKRSSKVSHFDVHRAPAKPVSLAAPHIFSSAPDPNVWQARALCSAQALEGRTCPSRMAQTRRAFDHRYEHQPSHRAHRPSEA